MAFARILVVDEDPSHRDATATALQRHGFQVFSVPDEAHALELVAQMPVDLVVADPVPPSSGGLCLVEELRRRQPDIQTLLLTGSDGAVSAAAAFRAGACDLLRKPVEPAALVAAVRRGLDHARLSAERALRENERALARFRQQCRRNLELMASLDLERLQDAWLSELCRVCDAQAGALWLQDDSGGLMLKAYHGLVNPAALAPQLDPQDPVLGPGLDAERPFELPSDPPGSAFYLPLWCAGERVGLAWCGGKLTGLFTERDRDFAGAMGEFMAAGLRGARRYAALEKESLRDRESGAYQIGYFLDYAAKEVEKARRYGRVFSLLAVDPAAARAGEAPALRPEAPRPQEVAALRAAFRESDLVARGSEGSIWLLLPETDALGARIAAQRARAALRALATGEGSGRALPVAVGAATYPRHGLQLDDLLQACARGLEEDRSSLARQLELEELDFFSAVERLLGAERGPRLPEPDGAGATRRGWLPPPLFDSMRRELIHEIARDPRTRGLLFVAAPPGRSLALWAELERVPEDSNTRIFVLGGPDLALPPPASRVAFPEGVERSVRHEVLVLLSENASYALVQRTAERGAPWGLHTSEVGLVDALASKLQSEFDLRLA